MGCIGGLDLDERTWTEYVLCREILEVLVLTFMRLQTCVIRVIIAGSVSGLELAVSVATRACMIVSDAIVIIVTWIKTWSTMRAAKLLHIHMSFTSLVLKEGMLYFVCVKIHGVF